MKLIPADPVNLSLKNKLISVVSCFSVIVLMAWLSQQFNLPAYPLLVASMGASAVIVFIIPNSPLAQPWPLVGGQLVSTAIGITCAQTIADTVLAPALAVGGSVLAMLLLRCLHPPGAASALAPILSGNALTSLGYSFVLMPVGINVLMMLVLAIVINRWLLHHEYPSKTQQAPEKKTSDGKITAAQRTGISGQDVILALQNRDTFIDVSAEELSQLLTEIQNHNFKQSSGLITCADIMVSNVPAVEYGTEVEDAWRIMQQESLKALPVIDKAKHVIGIVTWHDFFKFIPVDGHESWRQKFQAFIRRTTDISTHKPEAIGHIMTTAVLVLPENSHIVDLIPLMSVKRHRQIPITNSQNRLVGMVYQSDLIATLARLAEFRQL